MIGARIARAVIQTPVPGTTTDFMSKDRNHGDGGAIEVDEPSAGTILEPRANTSFVNL